MMYVRRFVGLTICGAVLAGCAGDEEPPAVENYPTASCITAADSASLADRSSPLDSVTFEVAGAPILVCFGRPAARGRTMIGGDAVPFGSLWRTGANEPTMIHTPIALSIGGVDVEPGTYSVYTVPNESEWVVVVNASFSQWGHEGQYTPEVEAQEVGRGTAGVDISTEHTESFTISHRGGNLMMAWENTHVGIPIAAK